MLKLIRSRLTYLATTTALASAALLGAGAHVAEAGTYKPIHVFCNGGGSCPDGVGPYMSRSTMLTDAAGNLYGTAMSGGNANSGGVVFQLQPPAPGATRWTENVLHRFCTAGGDCPDGSGPEAGLTKDNLGNLYGTTDYGGNANHAGVVYELVKPTSGTTWTTKILYRFCPQGGACVDGKRPWSGVIMDGTGKLFGTTVTGGGALNGGVAYELIPTAGGSGWTYKTIYRFCSMPGCPDGALVSGLLLGNDGDLYGEALAGGADSNTGLIFRLVPTDTSRTNWTFESLYKFCSGDVRPCPDGADPGGNLISNPNGRLYGTTASGGKYNNGVVFTLTPPTTGTQWVYRILYSFCKLGGACPDGSGGGDGPLFLKAGILYGTTRNGGNANDAGVLYELDPPTPGGGWTQKVLRRFCGQGGTCPDGETPESGVTIDASGHIIGAASAGANLRGAGLIFEYTP